jgi:hypothetical protein
MCKRFSPLSYFSYSSSLLSLVVVVIAFWMSNETLVHCACCAVSQISNLVAASDHTQVICFTASALGGGAFACYERICTRAAAVEKERLDRDERRLDRDTQTEKERLDRELALLGMLGSTDKIQLALEKIAALELDRNKIAGTKGAHPIADKPVPSPVLRPTVPSKTVATTGPSKSAASTEPSKTAATTTGTAIASSKKI